MNTRIIVALFLIFVSIISMPVNSYADEIEVKNDLWEEKRAYDFDGKYSGVGDEEVYYGGFYETVSNINLFLYTDAALNYPWTELFVDYEKTDLKDPEYSLGWMKTGFIRLGDCFYYNEQLFELMKINAGKKPLLYTLVHELSLTREDLEQAVDRYLHDPQYLRTVFYIDEEHDNDTFYNEIIAAVGSGITHLSYSIDWLGLSDASDRTTAYEPMADFMMKALFLDDEATALALLCRPWSLYIDGSVWSVVHMEGLQGYNALSGKRVDDESIFASVSDEELVKIDRNAIQLFTEFMELSLTGSNGFEIPLMPRYREKLPYVLSFLSSVAVPKVGARTGVYLGAAALCAALLVGGVSILRKRKRAFSV